MSVDLSLTPILLALLNLLIGGVLVQMIRNRPVMKKIDAERESNLLEERAEEMASMRDRLAGLEKKLEDKDRKIEAERSLYRHRIANLGTSFQALLMLLKKGVPVVDAVEEVEALRAEQLEREAKEAATYRAAGIIIDMPGDEVG